MKIKYIIPFLPLDSYLECPSLPFYCPIYLMPIKYYPANKAIRLTWGLEWFYFSCLWEKKGNLSRYRWFLHLWLNGITFLFFPYLLINNKLNSGNFNIYCSDI